MKKPTLVQRDRSVVWHPFTQTGMNHDPLVVSRAQGARLILEHGQELIDGISSWWCNIHGHGHPALVEAAKQQFETLDHVLFGGCTHEPAVLLAERLLNLLPGNLSKIFFSDNGSTAVEVALKLAVQYWHNKGKPRSKILALQNSYHGDTFGAMAAGHRGIFSKPFDSMMFEVTHLPVHPDSATLEHVRDLCTSQQVAACIFEPRVQGAGGMVVYDLADLDRYIEICREFGVITIADEVMTGFGRTGQLFACEALKSRPDIICLSKGITSGSLPLAVTACCESIFNEFISADHSKTFFHGHTYTGNPIACAVALASLDLLLSKECSTSRTRIEAAHMECANVLTRTNRARNVRVAGTILAYDYHDLTAEGYLSSVKERAISFFKERGILLRPLGNVVYAMPPYCISDSELATLHAAMVQFASGI